MTEKELFDITQKICEFERYKSITPIGRKRQIFEADNGDTIIIAISKSCNQKNRGNFHEIIHDDAIWERIYKNPNGAYYFIYFNGSDVQYYRTDLKPLINNRSKDNPTREKRRYLCRIMIEDTFNGGEYIRVMGGNKFTTLFLLSRVFVDDVDADNRTYYTYLMTDENNGSTKIGFSSNPQYRERTLQSEKPSIVLKKQIPFHTESEARNLESKLHQRYKNKGYGLRGEWFNLPYKEIVELLNEFDWRKPA